jgi:hypothetical protein
MATFRIYQIDANNSETTSQGDFPTTGGQYGHVLWFLAFGEIYMTKGITLHSATVNMAAYNSSMPLFLYFCNTIELGDLQYRNNVVKTMKFEAGNYDPSNLSFVNQVNKVWTEPTGTYYVLWSQMQPSGTGTGNPDMRMVITDDPVDAIPQYRHTPKTGFWYWTGTIDALPTVPDAPNLSARSNQNAQVTLNWTAPDDGGSPITYYIVQYRTDSSSWFTSSNPISTSISETVTGLTNGTLYYFQVAAVNASGTGAYYSNTATPSTVPDAPSLSCISEVGMFL